MNISYLSGWVKKWLGRLQETVQPKKEVESNQPLNKEVKKSRKRFVSFEEAMKFARDNNIQTSRQWKSKSITKLPRQIPRHPNVVYREEFEKIGGWGGFLGTGRVSLIKQKEKRQLVSPPLWASPVPSRRSPPFSENRSKNR